MVATEHQLYSGYYRRDVPEPDLELAHVGPGTPGGEYLRRFWHPVGLTAELQDLPRRIRVLGEDLVLFRDGRGEIGLLALHCSHRGTSLEFGMVERRGLRCCYHGWLYDVDGRILETPGEPDDSPLSARVVHGAYPTYEYKGLVFAYLGPPERMPEFPIYDVFDLPGYRMVPSGNGSEGFSDCDPCNWLQLAENNIDAVHFVFLHYPEDARARLEGFLPSLNPEASLDGYFDTGLPEYEGELGQIVGDYKKRTLDWQESPIGVLGIHTRRVDDFVWVRLGDYIMPTIDQFAPSRVVPREEQAYEAPHGTHWTVPIDDTHTTGFGFRYVLEDGRRAGTGAPPGLRGGTEARGRTYPVRQSQPGDYEAQESQREMAVHALEHLGTTDQGVIMVRKLLREGIRAVQRGEDPRLTVPVVGQVIPTYCRNTFLRIPPAPTPEAERELLRSTGRRFAAALVAGQDPIAAVTASQR